MLTNQYTHGSSKYGKKPSYMHCASVVALDGDKQYIAYYSGRECSDEQRVCIEYWHNGTFRAITQLPHRTGNPIIFNMLGNIYVIYSVFEDVDENNNIAANPIDRWKYCSNWIRSVIMKDEIILGNAYKIELPIGYLFRCAPVLGRDSESLILPAYNEKTFTSSLLKAKFYRRTLEANYISELTEIPIKQNKICNIQPTYWQDKHGSYVLCRNIGVKNGYAYYSECNVNSNWEWTKPSITNVTNDNNSLVVVDISASPSVIRKYKEETPNDPLIIYNLGNGRSNLVLGRYNVATRTAKPVLKLNSYTNGSYPNYSINNGILHIIYSDNREGISRVTIDHEALLEIEKLSEQENKLLHLNNLPWFVVK